MELLDTALQRNTIVCLGTGTGKTFIGIMLINELAHQTRIPFNNSGKRTIFLVDSGNTRIWQVLKSCWGASIISTKRFGNPMWLQERDLPTPIWTFLWKIIDAPLKDLNVVIPKKCLTFLWSPLMTPILILSRELQRQDKTSCKTSMKFSIFTIQLNLDMKSVSPFGVHVSKSGLYSKVVFISRLTKILQNGLH